MMLLIAMALVIIMLPFSSSVSSASIKIESEYYDISCYNDDIILKTFRPPCNEKYDEPIGDFHWARADKSKGKIEAFSCADEWIYKTDSEAWLSYTYTAPRKQYISSIRFKEIYCSVDITANGEWHHYDKGQTGFKITCMDEEAFKREVKPGDDNIYNRAWNFGHVIYVGEYLEPGEKIKIRYKLDVWAEVTKKGFCGSWVHEFSVREVVVYGSHPPDTPNMPLGPTSVRKGKEHTFTTNDCNDYDGNLLGYEWDFNCDGDVDMFTLKPKANYRFYDKGLHIVRVRTIDERALESEWSEGLKVKVGLSRSLVKNWDIFRMFPRLNYFVI